MGGGANIKYQTPPQYQTPSHVPAALNVYAVRAVCGGGGSTSLLVLGPEKKKYFLKRNPLS